MVRRLDPTRRDPHTALLTWGPQLVSGGGTARETILVWHWPKAVVPNAHYERLCAHGRHVLTHAAEHHGSARRRSETWPRFVGHDAGMFNRANAFSRNCSAPVMLFPSPILTYQPSIELVLDTAGLLSPRPPVLEAGYRKPSNRPPPVDAVHLRSRSNFEAALEPSRAPVQSSGKLELRVRAVTLPLGALFRQRLSPCGDRTQTRKQQ